MRNGAHCPGMESNFPINIGRGPEHTTQFQRTEPITTHLKSFLFNMRTDVQTGPIMVKSNADPPCMNRVLIAHRATDIAYRKGPAHKVQVIIPSAPIPSPQSACIRTLRSTRLRPKFSSSLRAVYGCIESTHSEMGSADQDTGHLRNCTSSHVEHEEEWYPQSRVRVSHGEDRVRDSGLRAADFNHGNSEDKSHRALCVADFEDSDDEDSLCGDDNIRGLDLEANSRWSKCNKELEVSQKHLLTTMQLQIQENALREIVRQALKARRNDKVDASVFSKEAPEASDRALEIILDLMEFGQSMIDAGAFHGEEGRDLQMMVRNNFQTMMRKATRPFRPSGIISLKFELNQSLEAFRQKRLRLLWENAGISMAEILKEKGLDLGP